MTFNELPLYSLFKWKSNQKWDYVQIKTGLRSCSVVFDKSDTFVHTRHFFNLSTYELNMEVIPLYIVED